MLDRPTTTLCLETKRNGVAALVEYDDKFPPAYVKITVDANNNATEQLVVHELLHVVISEIIIGKFDATLEEAFVLGLENYMWAWIDDSKPRLAKWKALIAKKLAESEAGKPETPLAELADRT